MNFKESESQQKLRGGYYTPTDIARFLTRWVSIIDPRTILEPSCGDGVFFEHVAHFLDNPNVLGFEIDKSEARAATDKARAARLTNVELRSTDFLEWASHGMLLSRPSFDAILEILLSFATNIYLEFSKYVPNRFSTNSDVSSPNTLMLGSPLF